jgi:hypothetical protein
LGDDMLDEYRTHVRTRLIHTIANKNI